MLKSANDAALDYIHQTRGWNPSEYRIEDRGQTVDGRSDVLEIVHLSDETSSHPGARFSFQLYIDRVSRQIEKELAGQ
jgi:hypothetical protein